MGPATKESRYELSADLFRQLLSNHAALNFMVS